MNSLIERLLATHRLLNREIRREAQHLRPDDLRLKRLKQQRLAVKDRLFRHLPTAGEMRRVARSFLRRSRALHS